MWVEASFTTSNAKAVGSKSSRARGIELEVSFASEWIWILNSLATTLIGADDILYSLCPNEGGKKEC